MGQFFQEKPLRVVAAGECMLELARQGDLWRLGAAGDSFNTALYMRRLGAAVRFFTAIGLDPFSQEMLQSWQREGFDNSLVLRDPDSLPGLYAIRTDNQGERSFHYWRQQAAVRQLFRLPGVETALQAATQCDLLYLTGITLSLFETGERQKWLELAALVRRQGGQVAFDPNYRPKGWASAAEARAAMQAIAPVTSIVLTTNDDEERLFGRKGTAETFEFWRTAGAGEVVVKLGANGAAVEAGSHWEQVPVPNGVRVVDSTGAGDAFNAAYLMHRVAGASSADAARMGNLLAGAVVQVPGAILPVSQMPASIVPSGRAM